VSGHGFNHAAKQPEISWALQAAEKLDPEGGGGFNPRIKPTGSMRALAPEGRFSTISHEIPSFSAASLAPEGWFGCIQYVPLRLKPAKLAPSSAPFDRL